MNVKERPSVLGGGDDTEDLLDLEEEDLAVSNSSDADAAFDAIIGNIEDIIMEEQFQCLQQGFLEEHYQQFDDSEENKLCYTPIFNQYVALVEHHLEQQLVERIPSFDMSSFTLLLQQHREEVSGDIFDMLLTFTDFRAFKEMLLDYRAEREGRGAGLSGGLVVTPLFTSSSHV